MKLRKILISLLILEMAFTCTVFATNEEQTEEKETQLPYEAVTKNEQEDLQKEAKETQDSSAKTEESKDPPTNSPTEEQTPPKEDSKEEEKETMSWTDFSQASYEFKNRTTISNSSSSYEFIINHVNFKKDSTYFIYFSPNSTKPLIENDYIKSLENSAYYISNGETNSPTIDKYLEKKGDSLYLWIVEARENSEKKYEYKEVVSAKQLAKPALRSLGDRFYALFFNTYTSFSLLEPFENNRTVHIKIGKITDSNILLSIKNAESNCLTKLMNYAKSANALYEGNLTTTRSGSENPSITNKFDIENHAYYYVYIEVDDANGTYRSIEDVSLYQGIVVEGNKSLLSYLDSHFVWNLQEGNTPPVSNEKPNDNTTAKFPLPQTGVSPTLVICISVVSGLGLLLFLRYHYYKEVE